MQCPTLSVWKNMLPCFWRTSYPAELQGWAHVPIQPGMVLHLILQALNSNVICIWLIDKRTILRFVGSRVILVAVSPGSMASMNRRLSEPQMMQPQWLRASWLAGYPEVPWGSGREVRTQHPEAPFSIAEQIPGTAFCFALSWEVAGLLVLKGWHFKSICPNRSVRASGAGKGKVAYEERTLKVLCDAAVRFSRATGAWQSWKTSHTLNSSLGLGIGASSLDNLIQDSFSFPFRGFEASPAGCQSSG